MRPIIVLPRGRVLRRVFSDESHLSRSWLGILFLCLDAALDVEKAYLGVYHGLACPLIANEIDLLKVCAIVTAIAIPAAIG